MLHLLPWAVLLGWLWSRVVIFENGDLFTAPENNFGDLPFHLSAITSFAYGDNFPPQNPIFAGIPFTYSFLIDFLTAFYLRAGAGWRVAFFIENFALSLSLVVLIHVFARRITGSGIAATLAPVVFFFNGGFGFLNLFKNVRGEGLLAHTYTDYRDRFPVITSWRDSHRLGKCLHYSAYPAAVSPLRTSNCRVDPDPLVAHRNR